VDSVRLFVAAANGKSFLKEIAMIRVSQFAAPIVAPILAPVVLGAALCLGGGCAHEQHPQIPASAAQASEGTRIVSATATQDGDVYIYDASDNKMIYSGKVQHGEVVQVDAEKNVVMLNGKTLTERDLPNDHHYKIFFDSEASTAAMRQPPTAQPMAAQPRY
jgi:CO dehydrogenase/acetyl-CoA synthase delta subunit